MQKLNNWTKCFRPWGRKGLIVKGPLDLTLKFVSWVTTPWMLPSFETCGKMPPSWCILWHNCFIILKEKEWEDNCSAWSCNLSIWWLRKTRMVSNMDELNDNLTELEQNLYKEAQELFLPYAILYSLVAVAGIVGNAFVLFMYLVKLRRTQKEIRFFIPLLAIFDLLLCVFAALFFVGNNTPLLAVLINNGLCKTSYFFLAFAMITSNALLLAIAIQRYLRVCRPLGRQMTLFWRRLAAVLVITSSVIYAVPTVIISGVTTSTTEYKGINISNPHCSPANEQYPRFQLIYYLVIFGIGIANLISTSCLYTPIMRAIYRHFRKNTAYVNVDGEYTMVLQGRRKVADDACSEKYEEIDIDYTTARDAKFVENGSPNVFEVDKENTIEKEKNISQNRIMQRGTNTRATNFNFMFFIIILLYIFAYVPTMAMTILLQIMKIDIYSTYSEYFGLLRFFAGFYVINHVVNPFIYAYFDMQMRKYLSHLCRRWNKHKRRYLYAWNVSTKKTRTIEGCSKFKYGNLTSSGETGFKNRTYASPIWDMTRYSVE